MSIFFDFDVGDRGRRFRRAVDADKNEISLLARQKHTTKIFGDVTIGSLIELSALSIVMINENNKVMGFMALHGSPNVPAVDPADWEIWVRNMFQRYYLSRNTMFVHFMCCEETMADVFVEEAWASVFQNDEYLIHIALVVPPNCTTDDFASYQSFRKCNVSRVSPKRPDDINKKHFMYVAHRKDFYQKLVIRRAVEEDNDDIVEILDKLCPRLRELYGDYYISEIIGRHPESSRAVIVAQMHDKAIGVMCLNPKIDYQYLLKTYELTPFFGLRKATGLEKEQLKRNNNLSQAFSDPILLGKRSPFDDITELAPKQNENTKQKSKTAPRKSSGRVNFEDDAAMRRSFEHLYFNTQSSEDFSDQVYMPCPDPSLYSAASRAVVFLDEDPFDYDIVNIDSNLLTVPEVSPSEDNKFDIEKSQFDYNRNSSLIKLQRKYNRQKSILNAEKADDVEAVFQGGPNAFIIELYALRDDIDERKCYDLLAAAFEIMKDFDYCVIRVPCNNKPTFLLRHFCFVPVKGDICTEYALYIAHRNAVLGKLRVRKAEVIDIPHIVQLMQNLDGKQTMLLVENSILEKKQHKAYVMLSGTSLVGFGILEPPEQIDFLQAKYNMDSFHIQKYHDMGQEGFSTLKTALVYPVFEPHFRFFLRDMMRLSGCRSFVWLTGYRNKWVIHKANVLVASMVPLMPRKSESVCGLVPELKRLGTLSKNTIAFSTWFINMKLTTIPKVTIDTRIVIVGASRTAMAFLNALLFSDASAYLTFTNVTLVSTAGLPYVKHCKPYLEMMFMRYRSNTDQYLKSTPYTYYVNVVNGTMVEINKLDKYIITSSGHRYYYDKLFLLFGKQYQHPEYLKSVSEKAKNDKYGNVTPYTRLDDPSHYEPQINTTYNTPDNVFIVNTMSEGSKALRYVKNLCWKSIGYKVIVYGASLHAYCCMSALLEMNVPAKNIIFVEPFPPEDSKKSRISVFCNVYVDQTIREVIDALGITVYRSYYLQSWNVDIHNMVTHINILSHFQMVELECAALFFYGVRGIDAGAYSAIYKCGLPYDGGILIDYQFQTKDTSIYAAGPASRYCLRYFADFKQLKYYDSYEVGETLGTQIRNQLDPLFSGTMITNRRTKQFSTSTESTADASSKSQKDDDIQESPSKTPDKERTERLPDLVRPVVRHCMMPCGLQYLDVRSPGMKNPHHYIQLQDYNGFVMETFKSGYFKIHLTTDLIVDGITCLSSVNYSIAHFRCLYGKSTVILNHVYLKYSAKKIDNFYEFFNAPGILYLYHERVDELFMMVKEILPMDQFDGDTVKEALTCVSEKLSHPFSRHDMKLVIRSKFEKSPHVEAITSFVVEWLSENEGLLPMYLQPRRRLEFTHDLSRTPMYQKRKSSIKEAPKHGCGTKPLELNQLLIQNVNTWGNVQYNIPLRLSNNETRSSTSIALRHIPNIPHSLDCKIDDPLPERVCGRDMVVEKETYKTTTGEYCVKPNPNKAMERSDCSINCRRVIFMTGVEKRLQGKSITQPVMISEMKDHFRGVARSPLAPPEVTVKAPDPEYIFDVVAAGRNEAPVIPDNANGFRRLLDPYVSTYRAYHKPFSTEDQYGIGAKDQITFYSEFDTPKVRGFGPRHKEIWMPLTAKVHRAVYDRIHVKKECHEVAACHNPVNNIKGVFQSEMKKKYQIPYATTPLASWSHGEVFDLAPFPPNPYQTNIAPFMYCSDYCHISQGTPPYSVIDQINHVKPHKPCKERYVVSRDYVL